MGPMAQRALRLFFLLEMSRQRAQLLIVRILIFQINLIRRRTPVLLQVYLPSGLFVIVSWISFIVPPEVVPGRTDKMLHCKDVGGENAITFMERKERFSFIAFVKVLRYYATNYNRKEKTNSHAPISIQHIR